MWKACIICNALVWIEFQLHKAQYTPKHELKTKLVINYARCKWRLQTHLRKNNRPKAQWGSLYYGLTQTDYTRKSQVNLHKERSNISTMLIFGLTACMTFESKLNLDDNFKYNPTGPEIFSSLYRTKLRQIQHERPPRKSRQNLRLRRACWTSRFTVLLGGLYY